MKLQEESAAAEAYGIVAGSLQKKGRVLPQDSASDGGFE